ncbi:MAG: hypothetical protein E6Q97_03425 [Desulfurellales bacterium]|nr:MAG: hypothetical protein E6Q97_03425 [Desulfurellales bacterium]
MASVLEQILAQRAAGGNAADAWYRARAQSEAAAQQRQREAIAAEAQARNLATLSGREGYLPVGGQAAEALERMRAATQMMPGDMPVGAPIPQAMPPQGFAPQPASAGDPVSPTGGRRPTARLSPGGAMPSTTPDVIQTAMAPVGGSAGPGTEIYGETYPTAPMPPMPQQPSAARGVIEEAMANRGDKAPWLALAAAGFGTAAGTSPHAMVNIGQGGLKGIEMYDRMSDRAARDRLAAATAMAGIEQQDRQAGFRERELGQGEQRIGIARDELRSKDADRKQAREDAAAKLRHEERKLDQEAPLRRAQAGYYDAQADYTRYQKGEGAAEAKKAATINAIERTAREYAFKMTPGDEMTKDPALMQRAYEEKITALAQGNGLSPEIFGVYQAAPRDPAARQVGRVYKSPDGKAARWVGNGWAPL